MSDKTKNILEWIECIIIAVVLALLIRYYIGTPTVVKQESMYPTLIQNERLILNRWDRTTKKVPSRGEIITFEAPITEISKADPTNPIAKYTEKTGFFNKFVYHVLEIGKVSYIKRVIGLPGDHVKIVDDKVYLNDQLLDEPYLRDGVKTITQDPVSGYQYPYTDIVVPEGCIFAMGDNREKSYDCRVFGCIPFEKLEGKVVLRFFPFNKFGKVE